MAKPSQITLSEPAKKLETQIKSHRKTKTLNDLLDRKSGKKKVCQHQTNDQKVIRDSILNEIILICIRLNCLQNRKINESGLIDDSRNLYLSIFPPTTLDKTSTRQHHPLIYLMTNYLQEVFNKSMEINCSTFLLLLNVFAARFFLDFAESDDYLERMKVFIQRQLEKIDIPFVQQIQMTDFHLADRLPEIQVNNQRE